MPQVSVIVPTYNSAQYISEAIDSVFNQTYEDWEIIVVDDGSTDNTKEVLRKYSSKIGYFYQENKGPSSARNKGIKSAKGKYIAFLDADDMWMPEKLKLQMDVISKEPSIGLVSCDGYIIDMDGVIQKQITKRRYLNKKKLLDDLLFRNVIGATPSLLVRKECFHVVGLFDETLAVGEDRDMWLRICRRYEFRNIGKPLIKVRYRKGSQSYYGDIILQNTLRFLEKVFSDNFLRRRWFLKRRAYGYSYLTVAVGYKENEKLRKARKCILRSLYFWPLIFLNKAYLGLFIRLFTKKSSEV